MFFSHQIFQKDFNLKKLDKYHALFVSLLYEEYCFFVLSCDSNIFIISKRLNKESMIITMQIYLQYKMSKS